MRPLLSRARVALLAGLSLVLAACGAAATPTVAPTPIPPRADPDLVRTAFANMRALQSFTWDVTQEYTEGLGDTSYSYAPELETVRWDRAWGEADAAHQTYRFSIRFMQGFTVPVVIRPEGEYMINPDGSAVELPGEAALFAAHIFFLQGMWLPGEWSDMHLEPPEAVTVTLGTPPSEVIDGVPTTHLVVTSPGAQGSSGGVEFWVDPQPPARLRRLALTTVTAVEAGPGIASPTEPVAVFLLAADHLQFRRLPDGALLRTVQLAHDESVSNIKILGFTPDGQSVIGLGGDKFYRWSLRDGQIEGASPKVYSFGPYALSPDGGRLVAETEQGLGLYRTSDWQRVATLETVPPGIDLVTISPDGRWVAGLARPVAGPHRLLAIWRSDGTLARTQMLTHQPESEVDVLLFTPDSRQLVTHAREAGVVQVWQVADGTLLHTLAPAVPKAAHLAISPDGRRLALTADEAGAYVWDLEHPTAEAVRLEPGAQGPVPGGTLHFSADGRWLLFNGDGVRVWPVADLAAAPVSWPLQQVKTDRCVWHWGHFNEPVNIPPLRLAPTTTP